LHKQEAFHQKRKQARIDAETAELTGPSNAVPDQQPQGERSRRAGPKNDNSEKDTGINKLISKVSSNKGGMSRSSLKSEWENLEKAIYESEIAGWWLCVGCGWGCDCGCPLPCPAEPVHKFVIPMVNQGKECQSE
jgi:hypothetical protein